MKPRNPFGTDAETLRYAATQAPLPVLAVQLRRIADAIDAASSFPKAAARPNKKNEQISLRELTEAFFWQFSDAALAALAGADEEQVARFEQFVLREVYPMHAHSQGLKDSA